MARVWREKSICIEAPQLDATISQEEPECAVSLGTLSSFSPFVPFG